MGETCVDKYEASLVEVLDDGSEIPFSPYEIPKKHQVRAVSRPGVVPQAYTSMLEARRACHASGKRLCRSHEWKAACRGPDNTRYPYGPNRVPGACVDTKRVSPVMKIFHGGHTAEHMNDPRLNQLEGTVAPTGTATACTNSYGVHDMVGNLHEWTDDGIFRGGYYLDTEINGEGCEYVTAAHATYYHDYSTGFRCCADADSLPLDDDEDTNTSDGSSEGMGAENAKHNGVPVADTEWDDDTTVPVWDLAKSTTRALAPKPRRGRRRR
ncbi:formylglycine-generating enzyme family protein [Pendulispora rubella]|uniref:Formylglycine-generating enzyme family protein n=1 Tax=Pendulispora rubella TaxID=2741070 RepID=A0ABZ2L8V5_9BACT